MLPVLAMTVAMPTTAQTAIEEITVTGTKRETNLLETPLSVTAFSQDVLDRAGVATVADLEDMVPNLQVGLSPSDSGVQISVRGLSSNNFTELGDPTVAVHFDGLYSPRPQAGLALMYDVESAEINRGPQGTLFGRNSTAGSVNVISKRPDFDDNYGKLEFGYGRFDETAIRGYYNFPISETFAMRASAVYEQADAWLNQSPDTFDLAFDGNADGDFDDDVDIAPDGIPNVDQRRNRQVFEDEAYTALKRYGARLSGRYLPNDDMELNVILDYFQDNSPGALSIKDCEKAEGTFFACDHAYDDITSNLPGQLDMTIASLRAVFEWQFHEDMVFEGRVAYAQQERFQVNDGSVGDYASPLHPAYGIARESVNGEFNFSPLVRDFALLDSLGFVDRSDNPAGQVPVLLPFEDLQQTTRFSNFDSFVTELQVKSTSDSPLQWIAGFFYMKEENAIQFEVEIPFCCASYEPLAQIFLQPDRGIESVAAFAQFDYMVNDRLNLTAGYRFTHDEKADRGGSIHTTTGFAAPNPGLYFNPDSGSRGINPLSYVFLGNGSTEFYQSDDLLLTDGTLEPDFISRVPGTDNTHSNSWSKGTWKLGFDYEINEDWFTYGYVATGFKAGGFGDAIFVCDACGTTNTFDYDPENNITYEWGIKTSQLDGRLNLLATLFYSDYDDLQQSRFDTITSAGDERPYAEGFTPNADAVPCTADPEETCEIVNRDIGTFLTRNIGEARSMGLELEIDWRPWEGGRINGWIAYLNAEITDYETAEDWFCLERAILGLTNCVPEVDDGEGGFTRAINLVGNNLPWSPEWSFTVNVEHQFRVNDHMVVMPRVSMSWQDEIFFDNSNFDEGPLHSGQYAYATYGASVSIWSERDSWGAEFYAQNLTDELVRNWADRGPGFMKASFARPRHFGFKINKEF